MAATRARRATLVIAKLDRLTRDTKFLLNLVDGGVDVLFCDLPQIPTGRMGRFMLTQMAAVAELEAGLTSKRTKDALAVAKARRADRGERPLGGFRGYRPSEEDRASALAARQQKAAQRAQDLTPILSDIRASGITSLNGIAKALNERRIPTPRRDGEWSADQVKRLNA